MDLRIRGGGCPLTACAAHSSSAGKGKPVHDLGNLKFSVVESERATIMPRPFSTAEKLRIQFRKEIRKGYAKNAELDPPSARAFVSEVEAGEDLIVRVDGDQGVRYWFSDRRLIAQDNNGCSEILRYDAVMKAHWMFKDLWSDRIKALKSPEEAAELKRKNFDRLEIELPDRMVVLRGLDQAYVPTLNFFRWLTRR